MNKDTKDNKKEIIQDSTTKSITRGAIQVIGGTIPFASGLFSAAASAWSENEQKKVNRFLEQWIRMLEDELREKEVTVIEIMARLDIHEQKIADRIESKEYQSLVKKTFREWAGAECEEKRVWIRNILANAAATDICSDDVIRLFVDWIKQYSVLHFNVIGAIYNSNGITRGQIWRKIGKGQVREDSAEADLYKLLFRDLSTGGIVRQHCEKDYYGNLLTKPATKKIPKGSGPRPKKSAFDDEEQYELTDLGKQFVHYAMTDLPLKIEFKRDQSKLNK